jgi:ribosomal-protein-alanine N-acetyltransferase
MAYRFLEDRSNREQVYNHLVCCNLLFKPALTERVDLDNYVDKIINHASRFEAWFGDRLVGLVAVYVNDVSLKTAFITNVSVEREHQGMGIAKKLLLQSIKKVILLKFEEVQLEVSGENKVALKVYQELGFKVIDETIKDKIKLALKIKSEHATS